jgi:soluble lytic murein transglycosylase
LSYEALGDLEAALAELDRYAAYEPALALFEQAEMQTRAGELEIAAGTYQEFLESFADDDQAPLASWNRATLIEQTGEIEDAIDLFQAFVDEFPEHDNAPEALYHAGWLAQSEGETETAYGLWQRAADEYTESEFGSAAIVRLLRAGTEIDDDSLQSLQELALNNPSVHYSALRARDLALQRDPFDASAQFEIPTSATAGQEQAESWLLDHLEDETEDIDDPLAESNSELLADERITIGQKLWELRLFEEAKLELEDLRQAKDDSLLDSYQLALFFRDLGLYRSSILAASTVIKLADQSILETPLFLGQLAYPIYFADHILPLSEEYDYDPRLQFSLVRQESLFESIARSGAAAQGLSQVIPDTGAWIAEQLEWPDYENEDLFKPHVGLEFGAFYLAEQLDAFDGDIHAALAAYNAGPGNAARWYESAGGDIDQFIDVVDFWETRTYIERIYAGFDIYRSLYEP